MQNCAMKSPLYSNFALTWRYDILEYLSVVSVMLNTMDQNPFPSKCQIGAIPAVMGKEQVIPKIKMLSNLRCVTAKLRLLYNKSSTIYQIEPCFKAAYSLF